MEAFPIARLIIVLVCLHCLAFIDRSMIGGVLPLLRESIAMTDIEAGWLVGTAVAIPYGVAALSVAVLLRKRSASRAWLLGGAITWTIGSLATGLAGSLFELTTARVLLGLGQGVFVPIAIARLIDGTTPDTRARALGLFTGGATFGRSIALLAIGLLLPFLGRIDLGSVAPWRWLFILTALPNIAALLVLTAGREIAPRQEADDSGAATVVDWRILLPAFAVAVAPVILAQAVLGWLPTLFVRARGLPVREAALLIGAVTLVAAPAGPILGGRLIGRFRRLERRMPIVALAGMAITMVPLAGVVVLPSLGGAAACMAVMLLTLGTASFAALFGVQLLIPPGARVGVNGIYLAFVTIIGVGLGPFLAGAISAAGGESGDALGKALLVTGAATTGICALAVAASRHPEGRRA